MVYSCGVFSLVLTEWRRVDLIIHEDGCRLWIGILPSYFSMASFTRAAWAHQCRTIQSSEFLVEAAESLLPWLPNIENSYCFFLFSLVVFRINNTVLSWLQWCCVVLTPVVLCCVVMHVMAYHTVEGKGGNIKKWVEWDKRREDKTIEGLSRDIARFALNFARAHPLPLNSFFLKLTNHYRWNIQTALFFLNYFSMDSTIQVNSLLYLPDLHPYIPLAINRTNHA